MSPALGALRTPPELLAKAWPIELVLAAPIILPDTFHSPLCDPKVTINQGLFGACVTYSGAYVQAAQEETDEGRDLLPGTLDPLRAYAEIKGLPYPFTLEQDTSPGLYPPQLWDYTKAKGWPTRDGSPVRRDLAYYSLGIPGSATFETFKQVISVLGPIQITSAWPRSWFVWSNPISAPSGGIVGGHAYEMCGWSGNLAICHQSWGAWGSDPYPNHFRVPLGYWDQLGWEAWKVLDVKGDAPMPAASLPILDPAPKDQLVDLSVGVQCYAGDGTTPLVKIASGGTGVWSPAARSSTQRWVEISTGGVPQWMVANTADCRNLRPRQTPHKVQASVTVEVNDQPAGPPTQTPPVMV